MIRLKKEVIEEFTKACENAGKSQASAITKLMNEFIEQNK